MPQLYFRRHANSLAFISMPFSLIAEDYYYFHFADYFSH